MVYVQWLLENSRSLSIFYLSTTKELCRTTAKLKPGPTKYEMIGLYLITVQYKAETLNPDLRSKERMNV